MRTVSFLLAVVTLMAASGHAQDAAQPAVSVSPAPIDQVVIPDPEAPSPTPILPELDTLDRAFNQTSLGKAADEHRNRVEMRKLQNQVANDPEVMAAKAAAQAATTDLEKRQLLRDYYEKCYGLMSQKANSPGLKATIKKAKEEHIKQLAQPRVRPGSGPSPTPEPTPKHKKKRSGKRF